MKKIILYTVVAAALFCNSSCKSTKQSGSQQNQKPVVATNLVLNNGQNITVTSSVTSDTDLGMGQMNSSTSSTNMLTVIATDDNNYSITNTLTKIKVSTDAMGQTTSFDSEKPEDKNSEIAKMMASKLNVTDTSLVNRMTGTVTKQHNGPEKEEKADAENPLGELTDAMGISSKDLVLESAFFVIPKDKKIGDSWTDSSSEGKMKTTRTYTLKSIDNNIATVSLKATITGAGETEMQGTSVTFTIDTKSTGELIVDMKKSLVSKLTNSSDVTMTMDVMGQSLPISGKTNSSIIYQY